MLCGLLGEKLSHSYSPQIHSYLGNYTYSLFEKQHSDIDDFIKNGDFTGLNVTIPYKKAVIPCCTELSDRAKQLGAVNTIVRKSDGTIIGHNTDYYGFSSMLERSGLNISNKKVLVLGSGGASATAVAVLQEKGANVVVISRSGPNNYVNIVQQSDAAMIVNTTPVGMYPNVGVSPVDLQCFPALEGVLDMIYNPARTKLLLDAENLGLVAMNGLWMLVAQAKESAEWFTDKPISYDVIPRIHATLAQQMQNVVLIGMPGCGKSSVCKCLAAVLQREFIDADSEIEARAGISIPDIFKIYGQAYFRKLESEVLRDLGKRSGLVIATGGGCITVDENYSHLHQNGLIIWLKRPLDRLPTDGRPLSQAGKLQEMFESRAPLYERFADCSVDNIGSLSETVDSILSVLSKEMHL